MTKAQIDDIVTREMAWIESLELTPLELDREILLLMRWRRRQLDWYHKESC